MKKLLVVFLTFVALSFQLHARQFDDSGVDDLFSEEPEFLPVDQAFVFDFSQADGQVTLNWQISEGYYLYKKQYKYVEKDIAVGEPAFLQTPIEIEDEFFGLSDVFYDELTVTHNIDWAKQDGVLKVRYQGCADAGLCYPPTTKLVSYLSRGLP